MSLRTTLTQPEPRFFVPEVVQTSAMDCGPAALKCLLEGFGMPVSYGHLREACQTDVDGTSINTLEDVAQQLGLEAEQMMAPADHLLLSAAQLLPALVVTVLPNGFNHFVVVWRAHGPFVQLMDPATGRRWSTHKRFLAEVYRYTVPFSASTWRAWAETAGFVEPLRQRLGDLDLPGAAANRLLDTAAAEESWRGFAALDAATRMVKSVVQAGGLARGTEAVRLLEEFFQQAQQPDASAAAIIPAPFWSVRPLPLVNSASPVQDLLLLQGAVLLKVAGLQLPHTPFPYPAPPAQPASQELEPLAQPAVTRSAALPPATELPADPTGTEPALLAALAAPTRQPEREILDLLRQDGWLTPALLAFAALLAALSVTMEAALLRGLMMLTTESAFGPWRLTLVGGLLLFVALLLFLELPIAAMVLRMGRALETRVRMAFLEKMPHLGDRYFQSRLISDMAQRAYGLRQLHGLPDLALRFWRLCCQLLFTTAGIIWLYPGATHIALLALLCAIGTLLLVQPLQSERDLRVRTHSGALSRFYLDALMGLMPIRSHSAERAVRREHEMLLVAWARESLTLARIQTLVQTLTALLSTGFVIWIVMSYVQHNGDAGSVLLLLYWTLRLPALGQSLATSAQQYPLIRNNMGRILEPLSAPVADAPPPVTPPPVTPSEQAAATSAVAIQFTAVSVLAGGHLILADLNLTIEPGEHVAIVGASGAGKSSLVGLLLGWQRPATGSLLVNGEPLFGERLQALRRMTAWVDPAVQLWNRSLHENLHYGYAAPDHPPIGQALQGAELYGLVEQLPNGLQTILGEGGGLLSGGEGQRVRLGRGLLRPMVGLVILDEPFRGLDRAKRRHLLANARQQWQGATLLCITHDIDETQSFTRVLVVEEGRIVEDGAPKSLAGQPNSRYRQLLAADAAVRQQRWQAVNWRHLWLAQGVLREGPAQQTSTGQPLHGSSAQDELQQIKGIGPVYARRLRQAGIATVADLANTTVDELKALIGGNGRTVTVNVQGWIEQARRLTEGQ